MAADLSTLDQMTGPRRGEYPLDHHLMDTSETVGTLRAAQAVYELAMRQNSQEVIDLSQEGCPPIVYNSITQRWSDSSRAHADTSTPHHSQNFQVTEHGGFLHEGNGRVQSFRGEELNSGISEDTASRLEYQQIAGGSSLGNDEQRVLLTFPEGEGEVDAVTITERDMEGLQPTKFLSNNIIDFYMKYLERRLPSEDRKRFFFFNSFFFTKLLGSSTESNDIDECKVDYEAVRKWSGGSNLFEKDFIFIPVLRRSHWSLIIICHLSSLWSSPGRSSPCILHLDAVEGKHESFEGQVRSYILQAWMERYQASNNMDQLLALCQMKYVQAKVPQQDNGYDCGLYLLHYVEVFLLGVASPDFSFASSKGIAQFSSPQFAGEVSSKRKRIQKLILDFSRLSEERAAKRTEIQNLSGELRRIDEKLLTCLDGKGMHGGRLEDVQSNGVSMFDAQGHESKDAVHQSTGEIVVHNRHQPCFTETQHTNHRITWELALDSKPPDNVEIPHAEHQSAGEATTDRVQQPKKLPCAALLKASKGTNKRKWTEDETSILLDCKVEGGRFCKENQTATLWDIISQEIQNRLGSMPSGDQCRLRYDTLLKAYKRIKSFCMKSGTTFSEITEAERLELRLATTLSEGWYKAIDEICRRWPHKANYQKRVKPSPSNGNGLLSSNPRHLAPLSPPDPAQVSEPTPIPTREFTSKTTLYFSKLENSPQRQVAIPGFGNLDDDLRSTLLNLVQAFSIRDRSMELRGFEGFSELEIICQRLAIVQDRKPSDIRIFIRKLSELKLVNIEFKIVPHNYLGISEEVPCLKLTDARVYKKFVEKVLCKNPDFDIYLQIRDNYDSVSFSKPPLSLSLQRIRVLSLYKCQELEVADLSNFPELRSLVIDDCPKLKAVTGWEVVKELGWLEIRNCANYTSDSSCVLHLPSLREFLFVVGLCSAREIIPGLDFSQCVRLRRLRIWIISCDTITTIQGLSGLHSLTRLDLTGSRTVRRLPELGCLKALTHLNVNWSGVEEIPGVQELHLLTSLDLQYCGSLKTLPCLGHLKALAHLDISWSGVDAIPGVQDLVSLETLDCEFSRLKCLPDLHHLPRLRRVSVGGTPLSTTDPSSFNYWKRDVYFNSKEERMAFVDDISDISDTE